MVNEIEHAVPSITTRGGVNEQDKAYAVDKVTRLMSGIDVPVLKADVKLSEAPDPARQRPWMAEATLDVNGQPVRAKVASHRMTDAIDLLDERLRRRFERYAHVRDDRRKRSRLHNGREENEWRHGDPPADRPEYFDRPVDDRELVRRKSFAVGEMTPDEAVDALELLGHDFFVFTNLHTGSDAVVFSTEEDTIELIDASGRTDALGADTVSPMTLSKLEAPRITEAEATIQLDLDLTPFVFFVDAETGRGAVAYHRYDGHYGLISAA